MQLGSSVPVAVAVAPAAAPIEPLAQKPPCAAGVALKRERKKSTNTYMELNCVPGNVCVIQSAPRSQNHPSEEDTQ